MKHIAAFILVTLLSSFAYAEDEAQTVFVFAHINDALMPVERGIKYEDPLDSFLKSKGIGEVTGGGTMQSEAGQILWIGVDIELMEPQKNIALVVHELRELGAPRGSFLEYTFMGMPQKTPIR
jgi:hypothetical protein